ncbi:MAG: hypothetical protein ACREJM_13865, partial [Candidatus Saccharimonadales bacterium]
MALEAIGRLDQDDLDKLLELLNDRDPEVRERAMSAQDDAPAPMGTMTNADLGEVADLMRKDGADEAAIRRVTIYLAGRLRKQGVAMDRA